MIFKHWLVYVGYTLLDESFVVDIQFGYKSCGFVCVRMFLHLKNSKKIVFPTGSRFLSQIWPLSCFLSWKKIRYQPVKRVTFSTVYSSTLLLHLISVKKWHFSPVKQWLISISNIYWFVRYTPICYLMKEIITFDFLL